MPEQEDDLFGYGTGYVPQVDAIVKKIENKIPDTIFDFLMEAVIEDAKKQGVNLDDLEDEDAQDLLMETVGDVTHAWVSKIREAAQSGDDDKLHFMLLPF